MKIFEFIKKYRDLIYIIILIVMVIIISGQCSKIDNLDNELDRQENNKKALTEQLVSYKDEIGRINAEKHAYQLTQQELRDSIGILKKKNMEYLSYINSNMNIKDTVKIETVIIREVSVNDNGSISFAQKDNYGKSSRSISGKIPYEVKDNKLYTDKAEIGIDQNIFIEGWLERNTKTNETYIHLRSDYPDLVFNSGMGVVAENGHSYEKTMRKKNGIGIAVGPNIGLSYDFSSQKFIPTIGVGVTVGYTYTPRLLQW